MRTAVTEASSASSCGRARRGRAERTTWPWDRSGCTPTSRSATASASCGRSSASSAEPRKRQRLHLDPGVGALGEAALEHRHGVGRTVTAPAGSAPCAPAPPRRPQSRGSWQVRDQLVVRPRPRWRTSRRCGRWRTRRRSTAGPRERRVACRLRDHPDVAAAARVASGELGGRLADVREVGAGVVLGALGQLAQVDAARPGGRAGGTRRIAARAARSGGSTSSVRSRRPGGAAPSRCPTARSSRPARRRRRCCRRRRPARCSSWLTTVRMRDELVRCACGRARRSRRGTARRARAPRADSNRSCRLRSELPTHMSSTSVIDSEMNAAPISPATRPGQERLAAAGRPVEQQAAAQALAVQRAQLGVAQRAEEGDLEPLLDLLHAADVRFAPPLGALGVVRRYWFMPCPGPSADIGGTSPSTSLLRRVPVEAPRDGPAPPSSVRASSESVSRDRPGPVRRSSGSRAGAEVEVRGERQRGQVAAGVAAAP